VDAASPGPSGDPAPSGDTVPEAGATAAAAVADPTGAIADRAAAQAPADVADAGDAAEVDTDAVALRLEHLTKTYPGAARPAVGDLDLTIPRGELVALVGPSGCGKTTTLKMINRLVEPTGGTVWLEGTDIRTLPVHELRRGIGYVIQQAGLFPHRKVRDNIATVPQLLGWPKAQIRDRVDELATLLDLDPALLGRYPAALSGGQQQRVGVARALAADPPVLLMDEPYSAVDPIVRARLQDELLDLQRRVHKTIVLVTHDIDEAIKLADRIAILNVGGVLEQVGTPEDLLREPANEFVADFLGDDRGIKRLSLMRVSQVALSRGPVVAPSATPDEARSVMAAEGTDWVAVCDGDHLAGWVGADAVDELDARGDGDTLADTEARPFVAVVRPDTTLKAALDGIVTSRTRVAVVVDPADGGDDADGEARFLGMLTLDELAEGVTR
ncbi:MAG TPA: betaine/proline/choline family ABC transporter ATP-binding protein, partial [Acidimicrobiales bacterium]|nr:betaine/proline/choline family ABC transporter ATP-binding protein [Acidimicrobiales bacterium]